MKKSLLTALVALSIPAMALADQAKEGLMAMTQADGTTLNVQLRGDEHHHFYLSEDGYALVKVDGMFQYALPGDNGLVASGIVARPAAERDSRALAFLAKTDRTALLRAATRERAALTGAMARMNKPTPGRTDEVFAVTGSPKVLVIVAEYADEKFHMPDTYEYIKDMLTQKGFDQYFGTGSALDYFTDQSMGVFTPEFDVYGPVTLSKNRSYYGGNENNVYDYHAYEMIIEACDLLDGEVDFKQYDTNGDGVIDNVYLFYAGTGESSGGPDFSVWPHSAFVTKKTDVQHVYDGVLLDRYACSNEWEPKEIPTGIGTFCHEFGHVLGLPDIYATDYSKAFTPMQWDIMDRGDGNNKGRTPCAYTAFERYAMGWIEPVVLADGMEVSLKPITENEAYMIATPNDNEYYLFENRQQEGWDAGVPWHGMLVWHIDYDPVVWAENRPNNDPAHQHVDIVEADGKDVNSSITGDPFPGKNNVTEIGDDTTPSLRNWDGSGNGLMVYEIAEDEATCVISFKVKAEGSGVAQMEAEAEVVGYYTADGVRHSSPVEGLNIVRRADGTSSKIMYRN